MNERREGALQPFPMGMEGSPARLRRALAAATVSRRVDGSAIRRIVTLGGALAVVLLLLPAFPAAGLYQTMDVMILAPQRAYAVGDLVPLTIHVLRSGVHEDADSLGLYVGAESGVHVLVAARIETGVYESTYRILPQDGMSGGVRLLVEAWIDGMRDQEALFLAVGRLEVEVSASPLGARPGSFVDITVTVRESGILRDADRVDLAATFMSAGGSQESDEIAWMQLDVGTYIATYAISREIARTTVLSVSAQAEIEGTIVSGRVLVLVEVPARLVVWHHTVSASPDEAVVEILAANATGWPEAGAAVALTYGFFDESLAFVRDTVVQKTDDEGVASFDLDYTGTRSNVDFWGTVTVGSASQGFSGSLGIPMPAFARRVDLLRDNALEIFAPGELATLNYTILQGGTPLPSQTLYYYAHTGEALVATGVVTSDASGRFAIEFAAPVGSTTIDFSSRVNGTWVYETDSVLFANQLSVEVGEVYVGGVAHLSASLPLGSAPYVAFIAFRPYSPDAGSSDFDWSLASGTWGVYEVVMPTGNVIEHDLVIPRFLPKDQEYLLYIQAIPQVPSFTAADLYLYIDTIRIDNRAPVAHAEISGPVVATGSAVEVNASASSDKDGVVNAYEVDWGDGATTGWSKNQTATHSYTQPGDYTVTIQVRDDDGAIGEAFIGISVEATTVGIPPLTFIAIALSLVAAGAAAVPIVGPRIIRALAKDGGTVARHAD